MRKIIITLFAVCLPAALAVLTPGCGGSDSTGPEPEPCSIDVYSPAPGAVFQSGDRLDLRWHAAGGGDVRVDLLRGGQVVRTLAAATPNDGYTFWNVDLAGAPSANDYVLRVASLGDPGCADSTTVTLLDTEGCSLALTVSPESTMVAGQPFSITWVSANTSGHLTLSLWKGLLEQKLAGTIAVDVPDTGGYYWENVDSFNLGTGADYYLHLDDDQVAGCGTELGPVRLVDDVVCSIFVGTPAGGSVLAPGDSVIISFTTENTMGTVDLRLYSLNTFVPGGFIASGLPADQGSYTWRVDDYGFTGPDNVYRVVVLDPDSPNCSGHSNNFTIR